MIKTRLPAYPLIPIDPLFSLWSTSDKLYDSAVTMWTGAEKPINGNINVDGKLRRFMGLKGGEKVMNQISAELSMTSTLYTFEDDGVRLYVRFTSPFFPNNLKLTSCPCAFIDIKCESADGAEHDVQITMDFNEKLVYENTKKMTRAGFLPYPEGKIGYLGRLIQKTLATAGDYKEIDWGWLYLAGNSNILISSTAGMRRYFKKNDLEERKDYRKVLVSEYTGKVSRNSTLSYFNVLAYDDIYSINYFGSYKKGYWTSEYYSIVNAIQECCKNHDAIIEAADLFDGETETEILKTYSGDYLGVLTAAYRQVFAGHKMIEDNGKILYLSKECGSNGCLGTVDVSYPSAPLFLLKAPVLVKGMLLPILNFYRMKCWRFDFAPHDAGVYPYSTGQVYGANKGYKIENAYFSFLRRHIYRRYRSGRIYGLKHQMPVEECGNMLILSAAYFNETGDIGFIKENSDIFTTWAEYLLKTGIDIDTQLCTDDFKGASGKNVNLAIKGIMGIAAWGLLLNKLQEGEGTKYLDAAKEYAKELERLTDVGTHIAFSINDRQSWSIKYNLVWDKIFGTKLFSEQLYQKEIALYLKKLSVCGLQLDHRDTTAKSDWMMWAGALGTEETVNRMSASLMKMLNETKDRVPFTDYFDAVTGKMVSFRHRTVQGGLWMPLYLKHVTKNGGHLF